MTQRLNSTTDRTAKLGNHAIVIGGSMAGMLAARSLADYFAQVTIIERDSYPDTPSPRPGIPQSQHLHVLLVRGRTILEQLFPGIENELVAAGASVLDMGADLLWYGPTGEWVKRFPSNLKAFGFSRGFLDWHIYKRLSSFPNVRFLPKCQVTGLLATADNQSVTGVMVRHQDGESSEQLSADLVVDASGQSSQAPKWLQALGYKPPEETVIDAFAGYATRIYQIPSVSQADWQAVYMQASAQTTTRGGTIYPIEGNRWLVSLTGMVKDYPPHDEAGFLDFARSLPIPIIFDAIKDAQPLSSVFSYHAPGNRWRHYERLSRQPEGFVVMGDAACIFNPVYGQGMTVAALEAIALQKCLQKQRGSVVGLAPRFHKQLSQVISFPWLAATSQDSRYPLVKGNIRAKSLADKLMQGYLDTVLLLAVNQPRVCLPLFEVMHMLKSSIALFHPSIFVKVISQVLFERSHNVASSESVSK